jgi:PAS domain S-box-containing protein
MTAERAVGSGEPLQALVLGEQVRGLYARATLPFATNVLNSSLLAYVVYTPEAGARIAGWLTAFVVLTVVRTLSVRAYRRAAPAGAESLRWGWYFAAGSTAAGVLWGSSAILLYPPDSVVIQAVILIVLGGMTAGAAASTATFFPAFAGFVVPAVGPITVRLLLEGDRIHVGLGAMVGIFALAMSQIARTGERRLTDGAKLRFENGALAEDLGRAQRRLTAVNDDLERRVRARTAELEEAVRQHERDEGALLRQKEVLQKIFDHSPVMLALFDSAGRVELVNREFERRLGWTLADLEQKPDAAQLQVDPSERVSLGEHVARGASAWKDFTCIAKDGRRLEVSWACVRLSDGVVIAIGQDITEQQKAREALAVSERMASIGTLAAGVAHEINNPLAFVLANLEFSQTAIRAAIDDGTTVPVEHRLRLRKTLEALSDAHFGAGRVRNIVRDLNTFSRGTDEIGGAADLIELLETSIRMADNEIKHRARVVRHFERVPQVSSQGGKLGQVFLNLLLNAAQAIPEGNASGNEVVVVAKTDGRGRAVVEIRDTGVGIAAEVLPRILDPFFTTKSVGKGMGLGLSICHGIVASMGGEIEVESTVGVGSTFRVLLPPSPPEGSAKRPSTDPPAMSLGRMLVVDDEPMFGWTIARMIDGTHEVVVETAARSALSRITSGETFDVILCDLMMPDMTGMEFFDALTRGGSELSSRIVFTTGGAFTPAARSFLERVSNVRLAKPFTRRELEQAMASVAARSKASSRAQP